MKALGSSWLVFPVFTLHRAEGSGRPNTNQIEAEAIAERLTELAEAAT